VTGGQGGRLVRIPEVSPHSQQAEEAILGAVLLVGGQLAETLATEHQLAPEHFYSAANGDIMRAMLALERAGEAVDTVTVAAQLQRTGRGHRAADVEQLAGAVPDISHAGSYAATVVELARWRRRIDAATTMLEAASSMDTEGFEAAERTLEEGVAAAAGSLMSSERLGEVFFDWLAESNADRRVIQTPFARLNELLGGGLRPGANTVLSGWTSMGKSTLGDQMLEEARAQGISACAYLNEMSEEERVAAPSPGGPACSSTRSSAAT
jgi:replicative DNA helicase